MAKLASPPTGKIPTPQKGMPSPKLDVEEFKRRYAEQFRDPAFDELRGEIDRLSTVAWNAYSDSRKSRS